MHPRSKQWHLIDYVICRRRDARDFRTTRAMWGAECWTDHRLVRSVVKLYIATTHRKKSKFFRPSYIIAKLKHPIHRDYFVSSLNNKLISYGPLTGSPTQQWDQFSTLVNEAAQSTLGPKKRVHHDWFDEKDEAITLLLDEKQKAFTAWQNDISSTSKRNHFKHLQHRAQTDLRRMQVEWWNKKADDVQLYADTKNSRMIFSALKAVTLLNRPSTVSNEALDQIPQRPTLDSVDLPPSLEEVHKAFQQTSSRKAPGKDGKPAEMFKTVGPVALDTFHDLLCSIWEEEDVSHEFRDATIVSLFKKQGK
ncbi:hypothetical protein ACOMHN_042549 [Nucella lapillus]